MDFEKINQLVELALIEDIGAGDVTTKAIFNENHIASATFIAKEKGIIAGIDLAEFILNKVDDTVQFEKLLNDGDSVSRGDVIATCEGNSASILTAERTMLNFMQRMSGIATLTNHFCAELGNTKAKILDTRKTMPGHRYLDKYAVKTGGGENHRYCLDDMFLIKENHIAVAGGITHALERCDAYRSQLSNHIKIEIEVNTLDELREALSTGLSDIIMLDNMPVSEMKEAVKMASGKAQLEASGNMTLDRISAVAQTGVDFISVGELTHYIRAMDISLDI